MVTIKEVIPVFPKSFVAVQVTCVEPIGNILPGAGVHVVPEVMTPPIAIGSGYDMTLPTLEDALCVMSDISENLGIIFSDNTVMDSEFPTTIVPVIQGCTISK